MAAFGEKIAISVVSEILKKLSSYPEKKIIGIWNVEKEFQRLEMTFGMLLAVLRDAENQQDNRELIGLWLERLKDVAFDADDVLGKFSFEATRMGIDMRIDSSKMEKVRGFFLNFHAVKFRSNMADKIKEIYKKLDKIGEDMKRFNYILGGVNIDHSDQNDRGGPMITSPVIEDLHFLGRENEKFKLIDMLIGCSSSNEETLSVVSIVGIGGLGKTTLARIVYNHDSIVEHFKKRMWVWVSHDFEIRKLKEGMVQSLTGVKPQSSETDEVIQKKLDENIGGKKFLLVLDNVWNADIGGWEKLRASLKMGIQQGSKIIVTTRDTSVASIIRTLPEPLHLKGLSEDDSWSLFETRAFANGGARKNPNTEIRGKALVEKCKGVPLAIKSLGALMHSKTTDLDWESIQFSEIWKLEGQDNILSVLKLSYHDMPPPVKRCFTYCSIFPKGHKFVKNTLIQMWTAEGLLQSSNDDKSMEDVGLEYFKSLVWVSFLQDVERDKFGEEVACKMHDLVYDLAQSIIGNECRIVEDFDNEDKSKVEKTRYLSVVGHYKKPTPKEFNMEKLRAYLYLGQPHYNPIHDISAKMLFTNFKSLRVLVLSYAGIESLPSSIGELKQLRYLDLSGNNFATVPKSITKLYNLQTLKFFDNRSFVSTLPEGITKMINLRHLEVGSLLRFPKGVGQLTNLQTLNCFRLDEDTAGIGELGDLRQLGGSLELYNLNWKIIKNATANLNEKSRLRKLELTFKQDWDSSKADPQPSVENNLDSDNKLLESLQPHPSLISLRVASFTGTKAPTWLDGSGISHLLFLRYLELVDCPNIKSVSLVGLCCLRWLRIDDCPNLSLGLGKGLTALEDIKCKNLLSTGVPPEDQDGMPDLISLKTLEIRKCESLATLPDGFFSHLTSLETLHMWKCSFLAGRLPESIGNLSSLRVLGIGNCSSDLEALPKGLGNLLSLQRFSLTNIPNLIELPKSFGNLSSLQQLYITDCKALAALSESFGDLLKLQDLTIINCGSLAALPESFGNLLKLQGLTIQGCGSLAALPESFRNLLKLQGLTIQECRSLAALPESFGDLLKLQRLTIQGCGSLAALPESLGDLLKLQELTIQECGSLAALPESFRDLLELQRLTIKGCRSLATLPESFGDLLKLQRLTIQDCGSLAALPESLGDLLKLQELTIQECGSLAALPESLGNLLELQRLTIQECGSIAALPESFGNLLKLQELTIQECGSLAALPESFGNLLKLQKLTIQKCESFGNLLKLQEFTIHECGRLAALPESFGNLLKLQELIIQECGRLGALPESFGNLLKLQRLTIKRCGSLVALPESFENLLKLQELTIRNCGSFVALPKSLSSSLESLDVGHCDALTALSENLGDLSSLKSLKVFKCPNLAHLGERICGLTSLEDLNISRCESMKSFPDGMHNLVSLHSLRISGLKSLEALPGGLGNLSSLRTLEIESCPRLMSLPDCFEGLTSLKRLDLRDLENLMALPKGLVKLSSLESLNLGGCKNLKYLPKGIQNLPSLRYLNIRGCRRLKKRYWQRRFRRWTRIMQHIPFIQNGALNWGHS